MSEYERLRRDVQLANENIRIFRQLLENLKEKISTQRKIESGISDETDYSQKFNELETTALKKDITNLETKVEISKERIRKESQLLSEGLISQAEFDLKRKDYLVELNQLNNLKKLLAQKQEEKTNINTLSDSRINTKKLDVLSVQHEYFTTEKNLSAEKARLNILEKQLEHAQEEVNKQLIVSDMDGYVSWLFNTHEDINLIGKGAPLAKISPNEGEQFIAKLRINQQSVKDVKVGQKTHIKVHAYNYYQYGILEGTVSFIDRDTANSFYVLSDIVVDDQNPMELKNGFKIEGEVIIEQVQLYQYIFNKLFDKMGPS